MRFVWSFSIFGPIYIGIELKLRVSDSKFEYFDNYLVFNELCEQNYRRTFSSTKNHKKMRGIEKNGMRIVRIFLHRRHYNCDLWNSWISYPPPRSCAGARHARTTPASSSGCVPCVMYRCAPQYSTAVFALTTTISSFFMPGDCTTSSSIRDSGVYRPLVDLIR